MKSNTKQDSKPKHPGLKCLFYLFICVLILSALLGIPWLVNHIFMTQSFTTAEELGNVAWLDFWGGYLSGIIGTIATLLALYISHRQHKEQMKSIHYQLNQQARLDMMPVFSLKIRKRHIKENIDEEKETDINILEIVPNYFQIKKSTLYLFPTDKNPARSSESPELIGEYYAFPEITLKNVGNGAALNLGINIQYLGCLPDTDPLLVYDSSYSSGESKSFMLLNSIAFIPQFDYDHCRLQLIFSDVFGNQYEQHCTFSLRHDLASQFLDRSLSAPKLTRQAE
ncbi:MAG: hypothetical protein IJP15_00850 [Oscillospiraceae bacterium]|nr:hypothetical protein [Oscillospiraceae bacterium]